MPRGAFLGTSFSGCFQLYNGILKKSNTVGEDFFTYTVMRQYHNSATCRSPAGTTIFECHTGLGFALSF